MKRLKKILFWFILSLIMMVVLAFLFTQTAWFRNIVKAKLVETANESINGKVSIGNMDGSFFTWLTLNDFAITLANGDTLAHIEQIGLTYAPLYLLKKEIRIHSFILVNPRIQLGLSTDSIWNFEQLLLQKKKTDKKDETATFSLVINLIRLNILNGKLSLSDFNPLTPERIDSLNLDLSLRYTSHKISASLKHLGFKTTQPNINLSSFRFDLDFNNEHWKITNFFLATAQNQISASAGYQDLSNFSADVDWPSIHAEEFYFVLPTITIPAHPNFSFNAVTENNHLNFSVSLENNDESISLIGKVDNIDYLLSDSLRHLAPVDLLFRIRHFIPNNWIEMPPIPLILNTNLQITGNGLKPSSAPLNIKATLDQTRWENYLLEEGKLNLTYLAGKTEGSIDLAGLFGALHLKTAFDINTPTGPFTASVITNKLALHQLLPTIVDSTFVTMQLSAQGRGIGTESMEAIFSGNLTESLLEHVQVDSMFIAGKYHKGDIELDTLTLQNKSAAININGFYGKNGKLRAKLNSKIINTTEFSHYFTNPTQWEMVTIQAEASGNIDSLYVDFISVGSKLKMDTLMLVDGIHIRGNGWFINNIINAETVVSATGISIASYQMDSTKITAHLNDSLWDVTLLTHMPLETDLLMHATGNLGKKIEASLHQLNFNTSYAALRLKESPALITYSKELIKIENLLITDNRDTTMFLKANAMVSLPDSIRVNAYINDFNLPLLNRAGFLAQEIKGKGFMDFNFKANRENVTFSGSTTITEMEVDPFNISRISANYSYIGDSIFVKSSIVSPQNDSILLDASSRLIFKLQDSVLISWPQTFNAHIKTHKTKLNSFYKNLPGVDQPKALVNMDIIASGHITDPYLKGYVDITGGELPLPKYGINYRDMRIKLSVEGTSLQLDSLFARHLNGTLLARGNIHMDSPLMLGSIKSSDVSLIAKNFYISRHRDHEIQIDAKINFQDIDDNSKFGGKITVIRSSFFVPALIEMADGSATKGDPLLVEALREKKSVSINDTITIPVIKERKFTFMEQLQGSLKIEIPRNTWIKSDDMQVEVYGNLDVVKNSHVFEIFGTMGIHRGYYTLYGKKLNIQQGEFTFTGGEVFDPQINLKAIYIFRSKDREKRELYLIVAGTATNPEISFELDKQIIPEADAMAYLLFGQPFDELSYGNQEGVSNAIPSRLVSGLVSSQLSRTIGNTLHLDMIEIDAGDNWQNTTFMVGKYIANNLFVTYQKSFGQVAEQAISPEVITLEYEIGRRISIRLIQGNVKDSGVDIILKFDK